MESKMGNRAVKEMVWEKLLKPEGNGKMQSYTRRIYSFCSSCAPALTPCLSGSTAPCLVSTSNILGKRGKEMP